MPRGDRTGPAGQGPRTGRGAGYCSGAATPGFATAPGRMGGRGRGGGGRGWRNMFHATGLTGWQRAATPPPPVVPPAPAVEPSVQQEIASLQVQANEAAAALEQIRKRIDELTSDTPEQTGE